MRPLDRRPSRGHAEAVERLPLAAEPRYLREMVASYQGERAMEDERRAVRSRGARRRARAARADQ